MSRQLEQHLEDKQAKRNNQALRAINGGLEDAVSYAGAELTGLNVKITPYEVLIVVKAKFPAGPMVAFCGAGDLCDALIKVMRDGRTDALRWRPDQYAK